MTNQPIRTEEYIVTGDRLVTRVKELVHESNIRRITLKDEHGKTLVEIPLTLGVIGALLAPTWAAVGAIAALVADLRIVVEKVEDDGVAVDDIKDDLVPLDLAPEQQAPEAMGNKTPME